MKIIVWLLVLVLLSALHGLGHCNQQSVDDGSRQVDTAQVDSDLIREHARVERVKWGLVFSAFVGVMVGVVLFAFTGITYEHSDAWYALTTMGSIVWTFAFCCGVIAFVVDMVESYYMKRSLHHNNNGATTHTIASGSDNPGFDRHTQQSVTDSSV
eukprot:GHVQ01000719.1.p1 GENE.GHVQ01000719.1~~GHVQ01000719.1.p1  ORF type:complete len:156 (+),score=22.16 GHVQ01000719.1:231-698(+)